MKLWLKHLLVPYMPPYQGDLAELTGSFRPFMTFVAFIWLFRQTFVCQKFLLEYILEDWPITCGFKASQIAICKIVKPFSICGGYALRQPFVRQTKWSMPIDQIKQIHFTMVGHRKNSKSNYLSVGGGLRGVQFFIQFLGVSYQFENLVKQNFKSPDTYRQTLLDVSLSTFLRFLR